MHGTFNGVQLKRITALKIIEDAPGFTRTTFCVLGGPNRQLEERLHLGGEATLILSNGDIDGRIVPSRATFIADTRSRLRRKNLAA